MIRELDWGELMMFVAACERHGVQPPEAVVKGLHLVEVAAAHDSTPEGGLLAMSDEQARERITDLAIRKHTGGSSFSGSTTGMEPGVDEFRTGLAREVRGAVHEDLERIVTELQTPFAEAAAGLVVAARNYAFTANTDPGAVIDMADEAASAAYRDMRASWNAIQPIASFRILISKTFALSPTTGEITEYFTSLGKMTSGEPPINWSVLFAEDDNWSLDDGYLVEGKRGNQLDWLAIATGGIRLNTPDEARAKLAARHRRTFAAA